MLLIDEETGEVYGKVPDGSTFSTPEQKKRNLEKKKEREQHEINRFRSRNERYIFVNSLCQFEDLTPATATKLIFLSTYAKFGGVLSYVTLKNMSTILGISNTKCWEFKKEVMPKYLFEDKNGNLVLNEVIFKRGRLKGKEGIDYQQFYYNGVRALYKAVNGRHHKHLGYVFQLLPYINREWNVLCHNPMETDPDKIILMTIEEFCELIGGYKDSSNIKKIQKIYDSILFNVKGRDQRFCTVQSEYGTRKNAVICVNPEVFYAGQNEGKVQILKCFFRE